MLLEHPVPALGTRRPAPTRVDCRASLRDMHLSTGLRNPAEPGAALAEAVDLRGLADQEDSVAVHRARARGWDREPIASAVDTPRTQVRARHSHRARHPSTRPATKPSAGCRVGRVAD